MKRKILAAVLIFAMLFSLVPTAAFAADKTYTLTIKYDFTNSAGTSFNTGTSDKIITGLAPGTVVDLSDHWPNTLTTNANGKTYYLGGFQLDNSTGGSVYDAWEVTGDQNLYVSWTTTHQITVTFDANGGSYKNKKIRRTGNFDIYADLSGGFAEYYTPAREGYKFLGWALTPDGPAITECGTTYNEKYTLYAIWEEIPPIQVGQVELADGEYTTNGTSKTAGEPTGEGYAHFENGVLTLNNFTYTGQDAAVIYAEEPLKINVVGTNTINTTGDSAMQFKKGYVIEGDGVLNLTSGTVCILGVPQYPAQIKNITLNAAACYQVLHEGNFFIEKAKLNLKSEIVNSGVLGNTVTIKNSEIVSNSNIAATSGDIEVENSKIVASEKAALFVDDDSAVKFIGGNITISGSDENYGAIRFDGNTLLLTLPVGDYWWRTSTDGEFTKNGFVYDKQAYIELTTTHTHSGGKADCITQAVCTACKEAYGTVDKTNHVGDTEIKNAKAATYTEEGYTGDVYCKSCNEKISAGTVIEKLPAPQPTPSTSGGGFSGSYNYPIVVADTDGADVTLSEEYAIAGETVTITVTPEAGKQVDKVIVTDEDGEVIPVTKTGDNKYSFTMPKGKVNVSVTTKAIDYDTKVVLQINNKNVVVNNKTIVNDIAPLLMGDRTLVPLRVIIEALGGEVDWNAATRTVTIMIDGKVLTLVIDEPIPGFGQGAAIMDNRTYVPIRYVAEYVGAYVEWITESQQIMILK